MIYLILKILFIIICSPYESENGIYVLLSDFYNNNYTTCQANCQYSSFDSKNKFLKCEYSVIVVDIDINNFNKSSKTIYKDICDILENSNYKTMKCYNLVFSPVHLKTNIGFFAVIFFLLDMRAFLLYI